MANDSNLTQLHGLLSHSAYQARQFAASLDVLLSALGLEVAPELQPEQEPAKLDEAGESGLDLEPTTFAPAEPVGRLEHVAATALAAKTALNAGAVSDTHDDS